MQACWSHIVQCGLDLPCIVVNGSAAGRSCLYPLHFHLSLTALAVNIVRYIPQYYRVRTVYVEAFICFISDVLLVDTTRVYLGNDLTKSYF